MDDNLKVIDTAVEDLVHSIFKAERSMTPEQKQAHQAQIVANLVILGSILIKDFHIAAMALHRLSLKS